MTRRFGIYVLVFLVGPACTQRQDGIALIDVNVVDVEQGVLLTGQTVLTRNGEIAAVGPSGEIAPGPADRSIDGTGAYLIPGLWDMHVHLIDPDTPGGLDVVLPLLIANGVTGVRDLGSSDLDAIIELREDTANGTRLGPRIVAAGKILDGVPAVFPPDAIEVRTPEQARDTVDRLAARGVDTIKAYELLQPEVFAALIDAAQAHGLPIAAHPPLSMHAGEVSDYGVRSFEHLRNIELACSSEADALLAERLPILAEAMAAAPADVRAFDWSGGYGNGALVRSDIHTQQRPRALASYDEERCAALLLKLAANGTWQTPTLFLMERGFLRADQRTTVTGTGRYVPQSYREAWNGVVGRNDAASADDKARAAAHDQWYIELVGRMHVAGIGLLAGTDISNPWMVPGFSLHEELEALVRAGLTPLQALQTATINAARFFDEETTTGTIEAGRAADLVLLDANPLTDIRNTTTIRGVMRNGRYLDRAELDSLLDEAEAAANAESTPTGDQ